MSRIGDHFSINTYSYTQTMTAPQCLRHLSKLDARGVELMLFPGHLWIDEKPTTLAEVRRIVESEGLRLCSVNTTNIDLNIASALSEMRDYSLGLVKRFLRIAAEIGAPSFILGPGKPNPLFPLPLETMNRYFHEALDQLLPLAREYKVALWAENMPFAFLPDLDRLLQSVEAYGESDIGICYDVANAHFIGEDAARGLERVGPRLKLVHFSDTTRRIYRHDAIGEGDVDFTQINSALEKSGLAEPPVLEIISTDPDRGLLGAEEALALRGYTTTG